MMIDRAVAAENVDFIDVSCYNQSEPGGVTSTDTGSNHSRRRRATMATRLIAQKRAPRHLSLSDRLARFLDKPTNPNGCWGWTGHRNALGYGVLKVAGRAELAHRAAWSVAHGVIPAGMVILHDCDNPSCCNLGHLSIGTPGDNNRDRHAKGRDAQQKGERHGRSILTETQAAAIKSDVRAGVIVAAQYGISPTTVSRIRRGRGWRHL